MRPLFFLCAAAAVASAASDFAQFNEKNELLFPADFREWIFLSSGVGMTYGPAAPPAGSPPAFDNVFVNPGAWAKFKETGVWPEGTTFILEIRYSNSKGSINQHGNYQTDAIAFEAAVKDSTRFPTTKWAYFGFGGGMRPIRTSAPALGANAGCQACHSANGAVEQTFTQFYPTALAIAEKKGTVRSTFQAQPPSPVSLFNSLKEKKSDPAALLMANAGHLPEMTLNMMGYNLAGAGDTALGIAVLKWTTEKFPQSANAQDSLAELLERNKQFDLARQASQRALTLVENDSTLDAVRRDRLQKALAERIARLNTAGTPK